LRRPRTSITTPLELCAIGSDARDMTTSMQQDPVAPHPSAHRVSIRDNYSRFRRSAVSGEAHT
jgi:hypothetical protein